MELTNKIEKASTLNKATLNKYVYKIIYNLLATVLLITGITKIIDPLPLINTLKLLPILNEQLVVLTTTILPMLEIGLGLLMLLKIKPKITITAVTVLFATFFLFSVYGTLAGLEGDCGCLSANVFGADFGNAVKSEFGIEMIVRNFILVILSLYINFTKKSLQGQI